MTRLVVIAAVAKNGVIGAGGKLPWHLPEDLKRFKALTLGKPIVMGRKTFESIGRALPGRMNIVVSRTAALSAPGCATAHSFAAALAIMDAADEVFVIGGAALYAAALPSAARLELTEVDAAPQGDVWFPRFERTEWNETARIEHEADEKHAHGFAFVTMVRR